jgi:hypothetical protein
VSEFDMSSGDIVKSPKTEQTPNKLSQKKKPNKGMRKPKLNFGSVYGAAIPQPHAKCHQVMLCSPRVFPWPANM